MVRTSGSLARSCACWHLDGVDELAVDVQGGHAVLQHSFAHDQHQVVPLALSNQLGAAETGAAGQDLVEGGFFARFIGCSMGGREAGGKMRSREAPADVRLLNTTTGIISPTQHHNDNTLHHVI